MKNLKLLDALPRHVKVTFVRPGTISGDAAAAAAAMKASLFSFFDEI